MGPGTWWREQLAARLREAVRSGTLNWAGQTAFIERVVAAGVSGDKQPVSELSRTRNDEGVKRGNSGLEVEGERNSIAWAICCVAIRPLQSAFVAHTPSTSKLCPTVSQ